MSKAKRAGIAMLLAGLVVIGTTLSGRPLAAGQQTAGSPGFLQPGQCYRIAFTIDGAPNYKILEPGEDGWVKAEVDAGSAKAQRQSLWINSAQIVTMRETRCSE
ncbi:MAG TPA: hypothetical protein VJ813_11100 [Vicinamibacterales bacterium]|nr:hypothetical protein [Vicinamibacterales bacterium]